MANEKQLLIEALKKSHDVRFTPGVYEHSIYGKAALLLEKSEEVVRCKDCKYFMRHTMVNTEKGDCLCYGIGSCRVKHIDDYCSKGKKVSHEAD